ncbi:MTH1187 family thiamine-binding protein [Corynebacterium renale]|uniref:Uncharacterized protein (TIGR00106 family) n=1 Tax=Corynebacterium renale TaxID=1724 RepID=A0A2A9DQN3_9CORY|nr:MTH1187 family thiamine-binding protein [Corynebacterium renale]PFG28903.1 uncharacterized protein (TIGR00106 family) [Corynebacterium renale]SQI25606.1 Uncharacterized conserved protein [Corynebacterium renale]
MLIAFSVAPATTDTPDAEMADVVSEAIRVVRDSGLDYETNAMFTLVEGEWDEVMAVVKEATEVVAQHSPRVSLVLKADIRRGYTGTLSRKVEAARERIGDVNSVKE